MMGGSGPFYRLSLKRDAGFRNSWRFGRNAGDNRNFTFVPALRLFTLWFPASQRNPQLGPAVQKRHRPLPCLLHGHDQGKGRQGKMDRRRKGDAGQRLGACSRPHLLFRCHRFQLGRSREPTLEHGEICCWLKSNADADAHTKVEQSSSEAQS
jgi:hypothetical protein